VIRREDLGRLAGAEVYDRQGEQVGSVGQVFADPRSGDLEWVTVRTGSMHFQESFVPLRDAELTGNRLTVAVDALHIKAAPLIDADRPLGADAADRLYRHYGLPARADQPTGEEQGDDAMTRSEERLVAGTRREPVETVRLRKYVVTEQRQVTVPVRREEVRLERVPVTEGDQDSSTPAEDLVLHEERPVVTTETVPVERVRLGKDTVSDEQTVTGTVRQERIAYEGPDTQPEQ
jgi:uncharacterized protein (TIGR02271 family)